MFKVNLFMGYTVLSLLFCYLSMKELLSVSVTFNVLWTNMKNMTGSSVRYLVWVGMNLRSSSNRGVYLACRFF